VYRLKVLAVAAVAGLAAAGPSVVTEVSRAQHATGKASASAELPDSNAFAGKKTWTDPM
jgi:hypothetical protein